MSRIRTKGFMHSKSKGLEKLKSIIKDSKQIEDPYKLAAFYLKETINRQPFSDGNHRTGYILSPRDALETTMNHST